MSVGPRTRVQPEHLECDVGALKPELVREVVHRVLRHAFRLEEGHLRIARNSKLAYTAARRHLGSQERPGWCVNLGSRPRGGGIRTATAAESESQPEGGRLLVRGMIWPQKIRHLFQIELSCSSTGPALVKPYSCCGRACGRNYRARETARDQVQYCVAGGHAVQY